MSGSFGDEASAPGPDGGRQTGESRDVELGHVLSASRAPDHRPGHWETVGKLVASEMAWRAVSARAQAKAGARRWSAGRRLRLAVAAAAAAACILVLWAILPQAQEPRSTLQGPPGQALAAARIVGLARSAMASVHGLKAALVWTTTEGPATGSGAITSVTGTRETRYQLTLRGDGSVRMRVKPDPAETSGTLSVYDARTGLWRQYTPGGSGSAPGESWMEARNGYEGHRLAPGPPDAVDLLFGPPVALAAYRSFAWAVQTVTPWTVTTRTYEGRPAWIVRAHVTPGLVVQDAEGGITTADQITEVRVTIDQATGFPVVIGQYYDGVLQDEYRLERLELNPDLPKGTFALRFPAGLKPSIDGDARFERLPLEDIAQLLPYRLLVPSRLPAGFDLGLSAACEGDARSGMNNVRPELVGRNVVSLRYGSGFRAITVTLRQVTDPQRSATVDPFLGWDPMATTGSHKQPKAVLLASGALAGTTARLVVAPLTTAHLWAVKDDVMVTIAGDVSETELEEMADSLEPYQP